MTEARALRKNDVVQRLRMLLNPADVVDERAKIGTELLGQLNDKDLLAVFGKICVFKKSIEENMPSLMKSISAQDTSETRTALTWALRRFILVTQHLTLELKNKKESRDNADEVQAVVAAGGDAELQAALQKGLPKVFGRDFDFLDVWSDIEKTSKGLDPIGDLSMLAELQKRRVQKLLYDTQSMNLSIATGAAAVVDKAIDRLQRILDNVARVALDTGAIKREPLRIENTLTAGVSFFQNMIGNDVAKEKALQATMRLVRMIQDEAGVYVQSALPSGDENDD